MFVSITDGFVSTVSIVSLSMWRTFDLISCFWEVVVVVFVVVFVVVVIFGNEINF